MGMNRDQMARTQQMIERVMKAQEELSQKTAEGTAGGGAVTATVNGALKIQSLKIKPEVIDPEDVEMLEDLVTAALNEALQKVQAMQMQALAGLAAGLGLGAPGGFSLPQS
jgi:DNA-binding YbaB/EbfC family protein